MAPHFHMPTSVALTSIRRDLDLVPHLTAAQLSRTTRSTRLGSGSSQPQKWSISAASPHGLDANDNSVAMVTETEAAFNENYLGHSMMDEPRQTYVDFDER